MFCGRTAPNGSGVIYENVDHGKIGGDPADKFVDGLTLSEIRGVALEFAAECAHGFFYFATRAFERPADADDAGSGFGQSQGHGLADASPASGDQRDFSVELELIENGQEFLLVRGALYQHFHDIAAALHLPEAEF